MYIHICIGIYTYLGASETHYYGSANLRTNIMEFRGFDSSVILILRGLIPRPIGDFPEDLSQAMLVGIMLVRRLGVRATIAGLHSSVPRRTL